MADRIQVGNVGTVFRLTVKEDGVPVDLSAASVKNILFGRPDGTSLSKAASFTNTGVDGKIQYASVANDLNQPGWYEIQAQITVGSFQGKTEVRKFFVYPNATV